MDYELLRHLTRLPQPFAGAADALLLERFVAGRDEAAFELLLRRHGPMVLNVCRRLLPDPHDAEDAFQAAFLILARKARSIARGTSVAGWLYRVAYRAALRARGLRARRAGREATGVEELPAPPAGEPGGHELRRVLDEEVNRLPARLRAVFVLCCLEGKTGAEAARELGCPAGTVSSRLTRARERLRDRLARRGLAPSVGTLAAALAGDSLAAPPAPLLGSTLNAALSFAAGMADGSLLSAPPAALARGVLRSMFLTKLKVASFLLLAAGLLVAGGLLPRRGLEAAPPVLPPQAKASAEPQNAARPVRVAKPRRGGLERALRQPCTVHAFEQANLYPSAAGYLKGLAVDIGDRVTKGQLLAVIDAPPLEIDVKQATIEVDLAKGLLKEAETRIDASKAEIEAAKAAVAQQQAAVTSATATVKYRKAMVERVKKLAEIKAVEVRIVDEEQDRLEAAKAALAAAEAGIAAARADLLVKESRATQAQAALQVPRAKRELAQLALEKAKYLLGRTRMVAPFDGVVTRRNYATGDYLRTGDHNEQPILTVQRVDRLRVVVQVPDRDAPLVEPGVGAVLTFDALPGVKFEAKVARVGFAADAERTMRAEIDLPNPDGRVRPGMYGAAALKLPLAPANSLLVPTSAVLIPPGADEEPAVYVVRDGKAHRTPVKIGHSDGKQTVIRSGLKPDDTIVLDPKDLKGDAVPVQPEERWEK